MTSPPTDAELLAAHVAGDPHAFGELFGRHRDRLWAVALRTMGNPEDAADGLQDAMVAAFRRAGSFRGDSAVTTWLHRVVVNACLDRLRAAKVRAADPLPDDLDQRRPAAGGPAAGASAQPADPADVVVGHERRDRVLAALARLPDEQRAALVLVDMEGYPVAEAARILGCAEGTVKSRCSRGRSRLAQHLADLLTEPGNPAGPPPVPSREPSALPTEPRRHGPEEVGG
ncbi:RNA polymerase sigma factor SigM [Nocardioides solisilvae]|uniref:RNA polymerase sigma factor SigM n=1 Tax=Nocardioides solisilvae TaxID=1542435 RepID=UPI000D74812F|nr:RNA polymerase sigma factor SigM [Nocardioides solisilvae]